MTFAEMSKEDRVRVTEMIQKIIGKSGDCVKEGMSLSERITARDNYRKLFDRLTKVWAKYGDKALAMNYTTNGSVARGVTPNGKAWSFSLNNFGWTNRCHHCGSLYIEGIGCVFTSGTMARAFERIFEN